MTPAEYGAWVMANWSRRRASSGDSLRDLYIMTVGLGGEAGEVQELLKKHVRDGRLDTQDLLLELGDVLHYLTRIAGRFGFTLDDVMEANVQKIEARARERGEPALKSPEVTP
jgi:NTP pyrophosphatase (non-canonical NTP hydrolase)